MGIADLREQLKDLPGAATLTMSYQDGGRTETYKIGETIVSVEAGATAKAIREAFEAPVSDSAGSSIPAGDDIVARIRNRIHDAPMETEQLLDEAADEIERLRGVS